MPRNANGVYALPSGNPVVPNTLIESTWANPTMSDIGNELTQSLPRNGSAGMTGPLMLARDGVLGKEAVTVDQLTTKLSGTNSYLSAGAVQIFAAASIPQGWIACNGQPVSRTTYAELFQIIGTIYGAGNGSTTFNVPDLRGEFIRGIDAGRGIDPGREIGTAQASSNASHVHAVTDPGHVHTVEHNHTINDPQHYHHYDSGLIHGGDTIEGGSGFGLSSPPTLSSATGITINSTIPYSSSNAANISISSEGTESRPRNIAMVYAIKAFGAVTTGGLGSMALQNKEAVDITGGSGTFETLRSSAVPVNDLDVVRRIDLTSLAGGGGGIDVSVKATNVSFTPTGSIAAINVQAAIQELDNETQAALSSVLGGLISEDPEMLVVSAPVSGVVSLVPQSNVPLGMVKLDAGGNVPLDLLPAGALQLLGLWDCSTGQNPTEMYPATDYANGDLYVVSVEGTILVIDPATKVEAMTLLTPGQRIIWIEGQVDYVDGWYFTRAATDGSQVTASEVLYVPSGGVQSINVQGAISELDAEKASTNHQQAATTVTVTPVGGITAANVQLALQGLDTGKANTAHTHAALDVVFTPTGAIAAGNVQAAIQELDTDKLAVTSFTAANIVTTLGMTPVNEALHASTADSISGGGGYLPTTGGTLTGPLTLNGGSGTGRMTITAANGIYDAIFEFNPLLGEFFITNSNSSLELKTDNLRVYKSAWFDEILYADFSTTSGQQSSGPTFSDITGNGLGRVYGYVWEGDRGVAMTGGTNDVIVSVSNLGLVCSGNITAYSDLRLKADLEVIPSALDKVGKLNGYTFTRVDTPDLKRRTGLIAQELNEVLPEAVFGPAGKEGYLTVDYGSVVGLLVEAIKELRAEVAELRGK